MAIEFYNVKTRQKVSVDESKVKKVVYNPKGSSPRYAVRAEVDLLHDFGLSLILVERLNRQP